MIPTWQISDFLSLFAILDKDNTHSGGIFEAVMIFPMRYFKTSRPTLGFPVLFRKWFYSLVCWCFTSCHLCDALLLMCCVCDLYLHPLCWFVPCNLPHSHSINLFSSLVLPAAAQIPHASLFLLSFYLFCILFWIHLPASWRNWKTSQQHPSAFVCVSAWHTSNLLLKFSITTFTQNEMRPQSEQPCDLYQNSMQLLHLSISTFLIIVGRWAGGCHSWDEGSQWRDSEVLDLIRTWGDTSLQAKPEVSDRRRSVFESKLRETPYDLHV